MWYRPDQFASKRHHLEKRARLIKAVREYFDKQDFLEVETHALQTSPGMEAHIHAFHTELMDPRLSSRGALYLHTSPEFAMKKLLVAGLPKIYQICHCFRNAENSYMHSCEFTMIEWYRANDSYETIMQDCIDMFRDVAGALDITHYRHKQSQADPFADWQKITVCEAFKTYAGIDLEPVLEDIPGFRKLAETIDIQCSDDDRWDDIFFRIFLRDIEHKLGQGAPTILYEYPISMAALSRPKPSDPRFAERFEIYCCGVELANAFGELTDAKVQRERFDKEMQIKEQLYGANWPVDEAFIAALELGMPEAGGIALGIDRLVMLATGADSIDDILWTPKP